MVEIVLWCVIGVIGLVGAVLGVSAAIAMGASPYRRK